MPALFGYLVVIGLLLGGGYGALNWLVAPEPAKVASKAAQKPLLPPHYPEVSDVKSADSTSATPTPSESNSAATGGNERPGSNDQPSSAQPQADTAANEQGAHADRPSPSTDIQAPAARAMVARSESGIPTAQAPSTEASKPTRKMAAAMPGHAKDASSTAPVTATKTAKRRNLEASRDHDDQYYNDHREDYYGDNAEQHDRRSAERRRGSAGQQYAGAPYRGERDYPASRSLALMTLRTIEFPDGRRVRQLLPYRRTPDRVPALEEPDE
jgi:hypothetical protein